MRMTRFRGGWGEVESVSGSRKSEESKSLILLSSWAMEGSIVSPYLISSLGSAWIGQCSHKLIDINKG